MRGLERLKFRLRFIWCCWVRGVFLTPLYKDFASLLPHVALKLREGDNMAWFKAVRRRKWLPQNWQYRREGRWHGVPMPHRWLMMLLAYWDAQYGDIKKGYQEFMNTEYLSADLNLQLQDYVGLMKTDPSLTYVLTENGRYVYFDETGIAHCNTYAQATKIQGGKHLDAILSRHPTLIPHYEP